MYNLLSYFYPCPCLNVNLSLEDGTAVSNHKYATPGEYISPTGNNSSQIDPPDDEPPSLKIESMEENDKSNTHDMPSSSKDPDIDDQGFFSFEPAPQGQENFASDYVSPVSPLRHDNQFEKGAHGGEDLVYEDRTQISHPESDEYLHDKSGYSDEKKMGSENENEERFTEEIENNASPYHQPYNDIDPIDTSHTRSAEYGESPLPNPHSPARLSANSALDSRGRQSPAMKGAHEILKRNRRRRAES